MLARISSQLFCRMRGRPACRFHQSLPRAFSLVSMVCEVSGHCVTQSYQRTCFEIPQTWERNFGVVTETGIGTENAISAGREI